MALAIQHVTAVGGLSLVGVGHDCIDGRPIGPVALVQNQTFFTDPHATGYAALWLLANSSKYTSGAGSVPIPVGIYGRRFRQGSAIPFQSTV